MELLKKFFNNDSTVIGLCDLEKRTNTRRFCVSPSPTAAESVTIVTGHMKKIVSSAVNSRQNFFMASVR